MVALINDGRIHAIDLTTLHVTVVLVVQDIRWYSNLAVDYVDTKFYFNHLWTIARANFDGTKMEIIPSKDRIQTFALDGIGRRLFWVYGYPRDREIYVGSLDLNFKRRLLTHDGWIYTLAVIPNEG